MRKAVGSHLACRDTVHRWLCLRVCSVEYCRRWVKPPTQNAMASGRCCLCFHCIVCSWWNLRTSVSVSSISLSIPLTRNSSHFLYVHTTYSHTHTHHLPVLLFAFCFTPPPSFTLHLTRSTLNSTQQGWEGDRANWGLCTIYTFPSFSITPILRTLLSLCPDEFLY